MNRRRCTLLLILTLVAGVSFGQTVFWDLPRSLTAEDGGFPELREYAGGLALFWQEYNDEPGGEVQRGEITVRYAVSADGVRWQVANERVGSSTYEGDRVKVYDVACRNSAAVIAVSDLDETITVYRTGSLGSGRFGEAATISRGATLTAPTLGVEANGTYHLFVSTQYDRTNRLIIHESTSVGGRIWSSLEPIYVPSPNEISVQRYNSSNPAFLNLGSTSVLVFQKSGGLDTLEQLFVTTRSASGWTVPLQLTNNSVDERSPRIIDAGGGVAAMTWLSDVDTDGVFVPMYARFTASGFVPGSVQRVTPTTGQKYPAYFPTFYNGDRGIAWVEDQGASKVLRYARRDGESWSISTVDTALGGQPYRLTGLNFGGEPYLVWEEESIEGDRASSTVQFVTTDRYVEPLVPRPTNFALGTASRNDTYSFTWAIPEDAGTIRGYSYSVDRVERGQAPRQIGQLSNQFLNSVSVTVPTDGTWYFHVRARDSAGNWSDTVTVPFERDTTPPGPVEIVAPETDDEGYLASNSGVIQWDPPSDSDLQGFGYVLTYLGAADFPDDREAFTNGLRIPYRGPSSSLTFSNIDNGNYALTVESVDRLGNAGNRRTLFFRTDKYVPVTYISTASVTVSDLGVVSIDLTGRGFSDAEGRVTRVIIDRDGQEPYDLDSATMDIPFTIRGDRVIDNITLEDVNQDGNYLIGVVHSARGLAWSPRAVALESTGIVRIGDFAFSPTYVLRNLESRGLAILGNTATVIALLAILVLATVFVTLRIGSVVSEGVTLEKDIKLLMAGEYVPGSKKRIQTMKRRGISLRIKFILLITSLVLMVVVISALPLSLQMMSRQERTLAEGLDQQLQVLLEGLEAQTPGVFSHREEPLAVLEFLDILGLRSSLAGPTESLTIVGEPIFSSGTPEYDKVYASDDPEIRSNLEYGVTNFDSPVFTNGVTIDGQTISVGDLAARIDDRSQQENASDLDAIAALDPQILAATSAEQAIALENDKETLRSNITARLSSIANEFTFSVPSYDPANFDTTTTQYAYYRPILYLDDGGRTFHGFIVLGFQTEDIRAAILAAQQNLIRTSLIIAAIAGGMGLLGALVMATIIIRPINRLVRGVEMIRDTEDKEELEGHVISISTHDEIESLAETVNQMTVGLVKAAKANKDLTIGKDVQKMFVPLIKNVEGRKLTTAREEVPGAEFFGYYEGAKGVSGDYFYYRKLEMPGNFYAFIKCDVAGKGVAASLIMVQVATMFVNYFKDWAKGTKFDLPSLAIQMNDIITEIGFQGRFAALIMGVFDADTGNLRVCHAGDNMMHIYRAAKADVEVITLPEAPAVGVFPSFMFTAETGYREFAHTLARGDMLLLFTDGLEEAMRNCRNDRFEIIYEGDAAAGDRGSAASAPPTPEGEEGHQTRNPITEEFSIPRIHEIVKTYFARGTYRLERDLNPIPGESVEFDFSSADGTLGELIMALVGIEKVFRAVPNPSATSNDKVMLDKNVDRVLQKFFLQYSLYFKDGKDNEKFEEYRYYRGIYEDEQYDDLTVLAIKKS